MAAPISVCHKKYCFPKSINMKIDAGKDEAYIGGDILMFKVKEAASSLHERFLIYDALGNPILTLNKKIMTMHDRWKVYKGESTDAKHLIFSVKRESMIQWGIIKLEVFLSNNTEENVCDFMACAGFLKRTCAILPSQSSTAIAKMEKNGGKNYKVTVNANTDLAFVTALITILDKTNHVDGVTSTTLKTCRMVMDPVDITGFIIDEFGEEIAETILNLVGEEIGESMLNSGEEILNRGEEIAESMLNLGEEIGGSMLTLGEEIADTILNLII